jgi:hypothetical protein
MISDGMMTIVVWDAPLTGPLSQVLPMLPIWDDVSGRSNLTGFFA